MVFSVLVLCVGAVTLDTSVFRSSVNDSSHVAYTVSSSLISRSLSCKLSNCVAIDESCSENHPSCLLLFTTHTKRTWRVTAPGLRPRNGRLFFLALTPVFSLQPWIISRSNGSVNVAPVLPAKNTVLSNCRNGRRQP